MAAMVDKQRERLVTSLNERFNSLMDCMRGRPLKSASEGARRGHWVHPEDMQWVDALDVRMAVADFKAILSEVGKIK